MPRGRVKGIAATCLAAALLITASGLHNRAGAHSGPARIVYSSAGRILELRADGTGRRQLTPGPPRERYGFFAPKVSPDGMRIAFTYDFPIGEGDSGAQIIVANRNGSDRQAITPRRPGLLASGPRWSPDGTQLAYSRIKGSAHSLVSSLVISNKEGSDPRVIARSALEDGVRRFAFLAEPEWSPTGAQLLYTRVGGKNGIYQPSLHLIGTDGTGDRKLEGEGLSATFSPAANGSPSRASVTATARLAGRTNAPTTVRST